MAQLIVRLIPDLDKFQKDMDGVGDRISKFGGAVTDVGSVLTTGLTLPIIAVGTAAIVTSTKLNESMANVATLIPGATDRVVELKGEVQNLAIATGKSTEDISGGLYEVISTFGDTADTVKYLEINARAAAAGLADTKEALALTSAVTKGYGDTSAEAVQHAADLAFQAVNLGQTTFPELAESIGKVVPIAAALGVSQEELFAKMATLTGVTGGAAEVSTQLRAVYQAILKPTGEMAIALNTVASSLDAEGKLTGGPLVDNWKRLDEQHKAAVDNYRNLKASLEAATASGSLNKDQLKLLATQVKDAKGELKPMADAVDDAAAALGQSIVQSVGSTEAIRLLTEQAGGNSDTMGKMYGSVEALTAVLALGGGQADKFEENLAAMGNVAGSVDTAFREQTEGINENGFAMKQLTVKLEVAAQKLGDGMAPAISKVIDVAGPLIDKIIEAADNFSKLDEGQQTAIVTVLAVVAAIGPLLLIIGTLITTVGTITTAVGVLSGALPLLGAAFTIATGPVGIIIAVIAALAAGMVILYNNNEDFRNLVNSTWDGIKSLAETVWGGIKRLVDEFGASLLLLATPAGPIMVLSRLLGIELGPKLIEGIIAGLGGLKDAVGNALAQGLRDAVSFATGPKGINAQSPSKYTAEHLGLPMMLGVATGFADGATDTGIALAKELKKVVTDASEDKTVVADTEAAGKGLGKPLTTGLLSGLAAGLGGEANQIAEIFETPMGKVLAEATRHGPLPDATDESFTELGKETAAPGFLYGFVDGLNGKANEVSSIYQTWQGAILAEATRHLPISDVDGGWAAALSSEWETEFTDVHPVLQTIADDIEDIGTATRDVKPMVFLVGEDVKNMGKKAEATGLELDGLGMKMGLTKAPMIAAGMDAKNMGDNIKGVGDATVAAADQFDYNINRINERAKSGEAQLRALATAANEAGQAVSSVGNPAYQGTYGNYTPDSYGGGSHTPGGYQEHTPGSGHAAGGIALGPTWGLFGEKRPGEALIPLDRLDEFMTRDMAPSQTPGNGGNVVVDMRGATIYGVNDLDDRVRRAVRAGKQDGTLRGV